MKVSTPKNDPEVTPLTQAFDAEFPKVHNRRFYLTMYLQLRESGDGHRAASETIRGEMLMAIYTR